MKTTTLKQIVGRVTNWWANKFNSNKSYHSYHNLGMNAYDNDTGDYISFIIGYDNLKHDK